MTLSIGATGRHAGRAIFDGLQAAERIGTQSIGGFVAFAALTQRGKLVRFETQRGGSRTLFVDGETCGAAPPDEVAEALAAALISSGPDRPEPLSQFLAADPKSGLVTGHRLPNATSVDGRPLNLEALDQLLAGTSAQAVVEMVMSRNPESDCGLIAIDLAGSVHGANSARVLRRPDVHVAERRDTEAGIAVVAFQNAIWPLKIVAEAAATFAFDTMRGRPQPDGWVMLYAGVPLSLGSEALVRCGSDHVATEVVTTDPTLLDGKQSGSAIYLDATVYRDGVPVGRTLTERICVIEDGRIQSFSGQCHTKIGFARPDG